jgi:hypothetical protein
MLAGAIGCASAALGILLLAQGWTPGFSAKLMPWISSIKPDSALALALLGAALATTATLPAARWIADALAILVAGLGSARLVQLAFRLHLRLDLLPMVKGVAPGLQGDRIEPSTAFSAVLLAVALLCTHAPART